MKKLKDDVKKKDIIFLLGQYELGSKSRIIMLVNKDEEHPNKQDLAGSLNGMILAAAKVFIRYYKGAIKEDMSVENMSPKQYRQYIREKALLEHDHGSDEDFEHMPEAPANPDNTETVKELATEPADWKPVNKDNIPEGSILALLGEDEDPENEEDVLTEDTLKEFILSGVSNTGKKIMKGIEKTGLKSEGLKAFFNNGVTKGIGAAMAAIAVLFLIRYVVTLTFTMRVNIAQYLRETADIIDEQIAAVSDTSVREKQENTSAKLKALAKKFDLDKNVAANKSERTNREFDETIMDEYTDEEIARSSTDAGVLI